MQDRWAIAAGLMAMVLFACISMSSADLTEVAVRVEARPCGGTSSGSGSVIGDGLVLTNAHLVAGSTNDVTVRTNDGRVLEAVVVGFDPARDLALLGVDYLDLKPVEIGDAEADSNAWIIVRPGPGEAQVLNTRVVRTFTATGDDIYGEGHVSRTALELAVDVPPGVSGAGVYDDSGKLVGVVFAESRQRDATAYAVASGEVRDFVSSVEMSGEADTLRCR